MSRESAPRKLRMARHARVRGKVAGVEERPRLCVFRSLNHIYAQVIDDTRGHTLAAASSLELQDEKSDDKKERAASVGTLIAKRALEQGINKVVFDRGGYRYHGRVKALADAARKGGMSF